MADQTTQPHRTWHIAGFTIVRGPRSRSLRHGFRRDTVILLLVALFAVTTHEFLYRQNGGTDFEIFGLSHAGWDMALISLLLIGIQGLLRRSSPTP